MMIPRSFMHDMNDDRIMSRTCLMKATVGDHNNWLTETSQRVLNVGQLSDRYTQICSRCL